MEIVSYPLEMAENPDNRHGGRREGAGRKPRHAEGKTRKLTAMVPGALLDELFERARETGCSRSELVTRAVRQILERSKP